MNIEFLLTFLTAHTVLAYLVLFAGSFLETIFILSFFIPGEAFFISGSILAGMGYLNIWVVIFMLIIGGIFGDNISFLLGSKYGKSFFVKFENKPFFRRFINEKNFLKGERYFKKYGKYGVFFARFMGPVSWVFPFIAGNFKLKHSTFIKYNTLGVILGIGQFIAIGYFGGKHYKILLTMFSEYSLIILFLVISGFVIYSFLRKYNYIKLILDNLKDDKKYLINFIVKKFSLVSVIIITIFSLFLIFIFFTENSMHNISSDDNFKKNDISLNQAFLNNCSSLKTYYIDNKSKVIQPINIIVYSNKSIAYILDKSWIKNKIFGRDEISFKEFLKLFFAKNPPVSNLYFKNQQQDLAFQEKSDSYISREHIRFWNFGSMKSGYDNAYVASISKDIGVTFRLYNKFITPVHEIDQNIDSSRDLFKNFLEQNNKFDCNYIYTNCPIKRFIEDADEQNYFTDGKILVCFDKN